MFSDSTEMKRKIREWKTCLTAIVDDRNRMVQVFFEHAPPEYGFVDYIVSVNNEVSHKNVERKETNTTSINFSNLKNGEYNIVVYPLDYEERCGEYCSRRKSDVFTIGRSTNYLLNLTVCGNNTRTQTVINLPPENIITPTVNNWMYYLLFLPLLLVIMALVICKWKRHQITDDDLCITDSTTLSTTFTGKVKVFVMYAEDHSLHTEACHSLIHYLNEHCFCNVLNMCPEYSSVPEYDMEKYADFVLVMNSPAFYSEFCAWKRRETNPAIKGYFYPETFKNILQSIRRSSTPGSCEYLMCAMDYMDDKYLPLEFNRCELFKITEDMTALVCHIQNIDLRSTNQSDIPRISEHIYSSPDGDSLLSAIENANYFEETHSNWFQETHTCIL